jgi:hypothetical protein
VPAKTSPQHDAATTMLHCGDAPCLVVLQTLGPFRTGVYFLRSCDRSCDI